MRLEPKVVPVISREMIERLRQDGDIEVAPERIADAEMDLSAILREYLTNEKRVTEGTQEVMERWASDESGHHRVVRREVAVAPGFKTGDEGIDYVIDQMIAFLLISRNVEEVFAGDDRLRPKLRAVLSRHLANAPPPRSGGDSGSGWFPSSDPTGGGPPTGAPAVVSDEPPRPSPAPDRDDGIDTE